MRLASRPGGRELAAIAGAGNPPSAYRVGALVEYPHVLQAVNPRGATLGPVDGPALVALKLPPPSAAATGVLPPAGRVGAVPRSAPSVVPRQGPAPASAMSAGNEAQEVDDAEPTAPPERDSRATLR